MHWRGKILKMHSKGGRVELQGCLWDWDKVDCKAVWKGGGFIRGGL